MRDHMEGFKKGVLYREVISKVREKCPNLKFRDFRPVVEMLNPSLLEELFLRKPCVRKLKYIGYSNFPDLPEEGNKEADSKSEFIRRNVYMSKDFNGGTYTINVGGSDIVIGSSYFEWID